MAKENKRLTILALILAIIVIGLGGYITYDKLLSKDRIKDNIIEKPEEKDYDLTEADKLVSIYAGLLTYREIDMEYDYKKHINENYYKAMIAYNNLSDDKKTVIKLEPCGYEVESYEIEYDDLNESYKYLFGKNENIEKQNYYSPMQPAIRYDEATNKYTESGVWCRSGASYFHGYKVNTAKVSGNTLKVNVSYSSLTYSAHGPGRSPYTGIEYNYDERQKYVDNESQQFDKYEFIYEYEDDHYILKEIVKN